MRDRGVVLLQLTLSVCSPDSIFSGISLTGPPLSDSSDGAGSRLKPMGVKLG